MKDKKSLKQKVAQNLEKGLELLGQYIDEDSPLFNEYVLLQRRFNDVRKQHLSGMITDNVFNVEKNRASSMALVLIDTLDRQEDTTSVLGSLPGQPAYAPGSMQESPRSYPWKDKHPFFIETFDSPNPGSSIFTNYEEGCWKAQRGNGVFQLTNTGDAQAVKYHYLNLDNKEMSQFPISLEVKIDTPSDIYPKPACGLIYCFGRDSRRYYTFHINNDKEFFFWRKDTGSYITVYSGRSGLIQPGEFNRLALIKERGTIYSFINDEYVKSVKDDQLENGDSGLIALGKGNFYFDNLAIYRK